MTAFLFSIGMFPYACMVLIPIFCYSNWPKKIFRRAPLLLQPFLPTTATPQENLDCYPSIPSFDSSSAKEAKDKKSKHEFSFNLRKYLSVIFCMLYVTEQTFLPWSHSITQVNMTLLKRWSFPLRISSVNVTKSAGICGFDHIYWRNHYWKTSFFLCSVNRA